MERRTVVLFWGAAAAAVLFLGSAWTAAGHLRSGEPANLLVFGFSIIGFSATAFVAGRIAFVLARVQRQARRGRGSRSVSRG